MKVTKKLLAMVIVLLLLVPLLSSFLLVSFLPLTVAGDEGTVVRSQSMINEISNTLDYLIDNGVKYLTNPEKLALWVWSDNMLWRSEYRNEIIAYLNSKQEYDGAWSGTNTRMFTTHRVLLAYFLLNSTPARNMDTFFANYDTWTEVEDYMAHTGHGDARNVYHVIFAWVLYYWEYPPWLDDFFAEAEADLSWTDGGDFHKRTHILYSYVIARRLFPNLDGIIDATLDEQLFDGSWLWGGRPVYSTAIQVSLLKQIETLYPSYRTAEIEASLDKAKVWTVSQYHTAIFGGKVCGFFGSISTIEDAVASGILCAGQTNLIDANVDMSFQEVYAKIKQPIEVFAKFEPTEVQVTFNATESYSLNGKIVEYDWNFGDGTTATVTDPVITHKYQMGTYTVTLKVYDDNGLTSEIKRTLKISID